MRTGGRGVENESENGWERSGERQRELMGEEGERERELMGEEGERERELMGEEGERERELMGEEWRTRVRADGGGVENESES